jgi:adenylate cyclase
VSLPAIKKEKREKRKRKDTDPKNTSMLPFKRGEAGADLDLDLPQGIVVLDKDQMTGIVNFNKPTSSRNLMPAPSTSPIIESSISEPNPLRLGHIFSDPWKQTPSSSQKNSTHADQRKVSPKSMVPPFLDHSLSVPSSSSTGCSDSPSSPEQWIPPESWAIVKPDDAYDRLRHGAASEAHNLSSGEDIADDDISSMSVGKWKDERLGMGFRKNTASSATSLMSELRKPAGSLVRLPFLEPRASFPYHFRIYRQTGEYHVVALTLTTTVQEFSDKIKSRMSLQDQRIQHNLYLKEQGRGMCCKSLGHLRSSNNFIERILAPHECPAAIVKLRQEQAGYDYEDGIHLFSNEALNMLLKFVYKSQVLAGVRF